MSRTGSFKNSLAAILLISGLYVLFIWAPRMVNPPQTLVELYWTFPLPPHLWAPWGRAFGIFEILLGLAIIFLPWDKVFEGIANVYVTLQEIKTNHEKKQRFLAYIIYVSLDAILGAIAGALANLFIYIMGWVTPWELKYFIFAMFCGGLTGLIVGTISFKYRAKIIIGFIKRYLLKH